MNEFVKHALSSSDLSPSESRSSFMRTPQSKSTGQLTHHSSVSPFRMGAVRRELYFDLITNHQKESWSNLDEAEDKDWELKEELSSGVFFEKQNVDVLATPEKDCFSSNCSQAATPAITDIICNVHALDLRARLLADEMNANDSEISDLEEEDDPLMKKEEHSFDDINPEQEWKSGIVIDVRTLAGKNQIFLYSFVEGIRRIEVNLDELQEKSIQMIKYRWNHEKEKFEVRQSVLSMSCNVRYKPNKGAEVRVYGLCSYFDFKSDHRNYTDTLIWTDAAGCVRIPTHQRLKLTGRKLLSEEHLFGPLRLVYLVLKTEFNGSTVEEHERPPWTVDTIDVKLEEDEEIAEYVWPHYCTRYDDLRVTSKDLMCMWLESASRPHVRVRVPLQVCIFVPNQRDFVDPGLLLTAIVVPSVNRDSQKSYTALILGPLQLVAEVTDGRIFNYPPVNALPPKIGSECDTGTENPRDKHVLPIRKGSQVRVLTDAEKRNREWATRKVRDEFVRHGKWPRRHAWDDPIGTRNVRGSFEM